MYSLIVFFCHHFSGNVILTVTFSFVHISEEGTHNKYFDFLQLVFKLVTSFQSTHTPVNRHLQLHLQYILYTAVLPYLCITYLTYVLITYLCTSSTASFCRHVGFAGGTDAPSPTTLAVLLRGSQGSGIVT